MSKHLFSVKAYDDECQISQCWLPSLLAKDPPAHLHGLRRDGNQHLHSSLYQISFFIMGKKMLPKNEQHLLSS